MKNKRPKITKRRPVALQIRGSLAWKKWLENLAKSQERTVAQTVEIALREYADRVWFDLSSPVKPIKGAGKTVSSCPGMPPRVRETGE